MKRTGLVIGKFMPLHAGHVALINFAAEQSDELIVHLGVSADEPIPGQLRLRWLEESFAHKKNIRIEYGDEELPDSVESSREVSRVWARYLTARYPDVSIIFSSEKYGDYLAEYMNITHISFDQSRKFVPLSASMIREKPLAFWQHIPQAVRPYYVKKVCIYGPESTGKSTLTINLAKHYQTTYVPEVAREMIGDRSVFDITYDIIPEIAEKHARTILQQSQKAERVLFCDTDHITTSIYSQVLFKKIPEFHQWIEEANQFDLYLFCEIDCPWVPDIQRFSQKERKKYRDLFLHELDKGKLPYKIISGTWSQRFTQACLIIDDQWPEIGN